MPEFLSLVTPQEALDKLFNLVVPEVKGEEITTDQALGRVTVYDILSPQDLPDFRRSTVDGYAVAAKDTNGASESLPAYLMLAGEVAMGQPAGMRLSPTQCALIHTGGMLPENADAVVMLEDTQRLESGEIEVYRPAAPGQNLIEIGEDVTAGDVVIPRGTRLGPAEVGGLMALGITSLAAAVPPVVGIISSGDEVISPYQVPAPGQVRDINSYTLAALIQKLGGRAVHYGIIPDSRSDLRGALTKGLQECDHLIVTAGSSASARDLTAEIMNEMGSPGVLVHGLHIKPGKPTILALAGRQVMIGLPGNPVSALVIAQVLVKPIIDRFLGREGNGPLAAVEAKMTVNISSQAGREDWIPVRITTSPSGECQAEPVYGRSNLIFVLVRADGLVRIPPAVTGLEAGSTVTVHLMD
ncbi:MAG: gephyrin-like molybdotransferase Glp [Anaerolineales bacterium]|jgi:molybdopterin molybdotransferase